MFRLTSPFLVLCLGCLLGYLVTAHSGPQGARADAENKTVRAVRSAECIYVEACAIHFRILFDVIGPRCA